MLRADLKAQLLNRLAQVTHTGFAGDCIRLFTSQAHLKTDEQVVQCVLDLQDQITDNPYEMMKVLGKEYDFIRTLDIKDACIATM